MILQLLLATTLIWLIVIRWNNRHKRKMAEEMQNNLKSWPIVGHTLYFHGTDVDHMNSLQEIGEESLRLGGSTCIWLFNKLVLVMADAEDVEFVLKTCMDKDDALDVTHGLLGNGSIFAPVSIWRPRRKVLAPHFNLKILWRLMDVHAKQSQVLVQRLKSVVGKGSRSLWGYMTAYTMDSIGQTILGTNLDAQRNNDHPFPKAFMEHSVMQATRILVPWQQSDLLYRLMPGTSKYFRLQEFINKFVAQLIIDKRKSIEDSRRDTEEEPNATKENRPKPILESFIEAGEYTDLEMHEETLVLVLAGTDTTAVAICFALSLLARYPDVQEKLYHELKDHFRESNRPVTGEDLVYLQYLDAVAKETLRLYPPVPLIVRKTKQFVTLPSGRTLAPGVALYIHIWAIHRNPKHWGPDVEEFRPERFVNGEQKHPAAYLPFSRGPRNCIGFQYATMSMKTVLINLVRNYKFLAPPDNTDKSLKVKYDVMLKHVDNFRLQVEART